MHGAPVVDSEKLWAQVRAWAAALGFSRVGVAGVDLSSAEPGLTQWLAAGFHGSMDYMAAHGLKRARPAELVPGTVSVITARMDYLPRATPDDWQAVEWARLARPQQGVVSIYARGRDYHKVLRARLQKLQQRIADAIGPFGHRVFTDSAPVLEAELAARSGQGWRGKHTLVLSREGGSMCFLGEIYVDLALPATPAVSSHCGSCTACMQACPTQAIVAPYRLDARRCISYLTIEHDGPIDEALRPLMGNRVYGCDDCQLACPWNKYAVRASLPDFDVREGFDGAALTELMGWSEETFLHRTEGSPIRRIGHVRWLRNVAVALGNALAALPEGDARRQPLRAALHARAQHPSALVREHVCWALRR
ncbi:MAG: tRNA epoxyqueuosine(34) reductase QueG [Pseudomonadota bacterium]|nr:tRNA epoxyqueuosine(34) reductase QueG [Pseudomonadota bacterium]